MRASKADTVINFFNYTLLTLAFLTVAYPLYFIVIASFSDPSAVWNGEVVFVINDFTLEGYRLIFGNVRLVLGYRNSLMYMSLGTAINVCLTLPAAYALSRKELVGRRIIMIVFLITLFFGGGLIPTYLVVRKLGMINTIWAMVIPSALSVYNVIIARSFFQVTIPQELLDHGRIDGCSNTQLFLQIVLPISKAIIAVMILFYAVSHWNSYFAALIYIRDKSLYPLQIVLREILIKQLIQLDQIAYLMENTQKRLKYVELIKYGTIIAGALPLLILYPFIQKHFVKGVLIGSLKD